MEKLKNRWLSLFRVLFIFFIGIIFLPTLALSQEIYKFERMWPTLQQPWYFAAPQSIETDSRGNVYVADTLNNCIKKFNSDGNLITRWGSLGSRNGQFFNPHGIAIDKNGNVFVVDWGNSRIQKFTSDGKFITKWGSHGSGKGQFYHAHGVAIDGSGNVYVTDTLNYRIQKFSSEGKFVMKWGTEGSGDGQFKAPYGIDIDKSGFVYVTDTHNYVTNTGNYRVQKFTKDGTFITKWGSLGHDDGQFGALREIEIDDSNNVYVVDSNYEGLFHSPRIQKFTSKGVFIIKWGLSGEGELYNPAGVAVDKNKNLYVTDTGGISRIMRYTSNGKFITKWGSDGNTVGMFNFPVGIALDNSGNVYVTDEDNRRIQKFRQDGLFLTEWGTLGSGDGQFYNPHGIAIDTKKYVYVVDRGNHRIQKFTSYGAFITKWGSAGSGNGQFSNPHGIAIDNNGNIYVVDSGNHRIQKFTSGGAFITKWGSAGSGDGQFSFPFGIAVDNFRNVFVSDSDNNCIQKFTSAGKFIKKWGSYGINAGQFNAPTGLAFDGSDALFVIQGLNERIQQFTLDGQFVEVWGKKGDGPGEMSWPQGLAVSSNSKIYIADTRNNRIQILSSDTIPTNIKAIIVAGGGPFAGNNLWDATQLCANFAYRVMTYQGFTKASIYYLSSDLDLDLDNNGEPDDVDGDATNSNLQHAITTWAADADNLVIYLIDHGGDGTFRMSGSETLTAFDLDTWLDQLQVVISGRATVVYDACESGSFLNALTPPLGKNRDIISSTSPSESAYFVSQGSVSFSNFFWTHVFKGANVKDAFDLSRQAIDYATDFQNPLLDSNGNGFGNEPEDFTLVQNIYIGAGTMIHGKVPIINAVPDPQTIIDTNSALLYADGVTDTDGIARVWAAIWPPDYSAGSTTNPVQELPSIDLVLVGGSRYEATYDEFSIEGTYQIVIYAQDRLGNISTPKLTSVSVNNPLRRKAIIVAGGSLINGLWPAIENNAGLVYETLNFQGYSDDDIYFLSPVNFSEGVDDSATLSNLNDAIGNWAKQSSQDLLLYLVGPGAVETFQLNSTEMLSAADLDAWLDSLQADLPGKVVVIYDASHSGSFLHLLAPPTDKERIVISSATNNQPANFISDGDISFSSFFWQQVINGANVRDAFVHAINAISYAAGGQTPMLDDNGNGIGNELGMDGRLARDYTIGVGIMLAGDAPLIGLVSPAQTLSGTPWATLWADNVTTTAVIDRVWAVITPPGYDAAKSDGSDLHSIELTPAGRGRYERIYIGFTRFGTYHVAVYAMDANGSISLPKVTTVEQTMGADIYEEDDNYAQATVIQLNGAVPQRHNFHDAGDQDWVKFYAIGGEVYEVKASHVDSRADVVIELYDVDGTTRLKGPWSFGFEGEDELMDWSCPADGVYYVMIRQLGSSMYGEDTGSDLEIFRPIGPGGFLHGIITDGFTGLPIADVRVSSSGDGSGLSFYNGAYMLMDEAGTYTVTAQKTGYSLLSYSGVVINEFGYNTCNFLLTPVDSDNDGISDVIENSIPCLKPNDDDSDDDGILDGNEYAYHNGAVDASQTNPCQTDTDKDGLPDGTEIGLTAPQGSDTDLNVFVPDADPTTTTDPLDEDSDNDGQLDGEEDANHNGRVDESETNPNQVEKKAMPWIPLLLLND